MWRISSHWIRFISTLLLMVVTVGCGGGGSGSSQGSAVLNLAGTWQASTNSALGYNTFLSGTLTQTGNQISGTMSISGSPCASSGALSGSVSGLSVTMSLIEGSQSISLSGTAAQDGNSMTGTYQAPSGGCTNGDYGTWTATKGGGQSPPSITSVGVSCSPSSILVDGTSKCSATVIGTGNFNSSVTWSVDKGTIDQNGNYTAPGGSTTATVTAASNQDPTKSGTAAITVNPATFNWSGGPSPSSFPITGQCFAGDYNGDKKTDIACYSGSGGNWNVALSTGSGWNIQVWSGGPGPAIPVTDQCFAADFNGDGKTDLACWTGTGQIWNVALSTGSGWQSENWNSGPVLADEWNVVPVSGQCFAADFNGDGKTDLACSDGVDGNWSVALSTGSGWNTASWSEGPVVPLPMTDQCFDGDFNGDGKWDLGCWSGSGGSWSVALSTGSGWQSDAWVNGPTPIYEWNVIPVWGQCFAADFNGDGKADVTCPSAVTSCGDQYGCTTGDWNTSLSTGNGWNGELWTGGPGVAMPITDQCFSGDFNADGKADLACWSGFAGGVWGVALSTGSSFGGGLWNGGPAPIEEWYTVPVGGQCFTGDFNGDGLTDVACYTGGGVWQVGLSTGNGW
jgi:hypothetical protein